MVLDNYNTLCGLLITIGNPNFLLPIYKDQTILENGVKNSNQTAYIIFYLINGTIDEIYDFMFYNKAFKEPVGALSFGRKRDH